MSRTVRVFRPSVERRIAAEFGIDRPVSDAVRLLRAGQENTERWLNARTATVGASEISILMMDEHPYHSRFSLWHVKAHGWGRHEQSMQQERGHLLEPGIARRFAAAHPELIVARPNGALWRDPNMPALSCTPDFLTIDRDGLVVPLEVKSDEGGEGWGWDDEDIPAHHWWQVQQQAGVFAAPYGYIARWNTRGYRDYRIGYDHDRYSLAGVAARAFLDEVAAGKPPPVDAHRSTGAVLIDTWSDIDPGAAPVCMPSAWGDELDALTASKSEIEKQIKQVKHQIRDALRSAPSGYDLSGRTYARTQTARRGYTVKPAVVDQVRTSGPRAEETS